MKIYTTTDGTSTDPGINYGECYAPLSLNREQYERELEQRQHTTTERYQLAVLTYQRQYEARKNKKKGRQFLNYNNEKVQRN